MNLRLKTRIIEKGIRQYDVAQQVRMTETRLSRVITGRIDPTPEEEIKIADALGVPREELFGCVTKEEQ